MKIVYVNAYMDYTNNSFIVSYLAQNKNVRQLFYREFKQKQEAYRFYKQLKAQI